jgi:hypothetical protein
MNTVLADTALGRALVNLAADHADWSQRTFGTDTERGPVGAFRHLEKETREAVEAFTEFQAGNTSHADFVEESADCLILLLDGIRRGGVTLPQLIEAARQKMEVNKRRKWPAPAPDGQPTEHIR